jgi:probable HAF family extracellular repeat protein
MRSIRIPEIVQTLAIVIVSLLALPGGAAAGTVPTSYTAVSLGLLPDTFSTVPWAINNDANIVGWAQGPQSQVRPFLWTPQTGLAFFPLPPGFTWGWASDISNTGIVVGTAYNGLGTANQARAWRWVNGVHELLPPFPSTCPGMVPTAVNDAGDVVGYTCPDGGGPNNAWLFTNDTGLMDLEPLGIATANDISNARWITGQSTAGPAYRWPAPAGRLRRLPPLPPSHNDGATGLAINESRQVTGYGIDVLTGPDAWRAFRYDDVNGLILIEPSPIPFRTGGYGINEQGHVVGNSGTSSTPDQVAWLWTPEAGPVYLEKMVNQPGIFGIRRGIDINDNNQIAATATSDDPNNPSPAVLLTPNTDFASPKR